MKQFLILLFSGVLSISAQAQIAWEKVGTGLHKDNIESLTIDASDHVYTITDSGLWKSEDSPTSWRLLSNIVPYGRNVVVDSKGYLYASSYGIYRSKDEAKTWERLENIEVKDNLGRLANFNNFFIRGDTLFACPLPSDGAKCFYSADQSLTWNLKERAQVIKEPSVAGYHFYKKIEFNRRILYRYKANIQEAEAILEWQIDSFYVPLNYWISPDHLIFVDTFTDILVSADAGSTWKSSGLPLPKRASDFDEVSINFSPDGIYYVTSVGNYAYFSQNQGKTWEAFSKMGLREFDGAFLGVKFNAKGHLFLSTYNKGIFKSTDHGKTWTTLFQEKGKADQVQFTIAEPALWFAQTSSYLYSSTDRGKTWQLNPINTYRIIGYDGGWFAIRYMNGSYVIYTSPDQGKTWHLKSEIPPTTDEIVGIDAQERIYAYDKSTNTLAFCDFKAGCSSWSKKVLYGGGYNAEYVGSTKTDFYFKSNDKLLRTPLDFWSQTVPISLPYLDLGSRVSSTPIKITKDDMLYYVVTKPIDNTFSDTIFNYSNDGGNHWQEQKLPAYFPRMFDVDSQGRFWYLTSIYYWIYVTLDRGISWKRIYTGANLYENTTLLAKDQFIASSGTDVYIGTLTTDSANESANELPSTFSTSVAYPNPFSQSTTFGVSLPKTSRVNIGIYNMLGQRIHTLLDVELPAGTYSFDWQANDVPSGVYFARIAADGKVRSQKLTVVH
jgi:photosystem II stability/assembly factor-like uncharacterized protein